MWGPRRRGAPRDTDTKKYIRGCSSSSTHGEREKEVQGGKFETNSFVSSVFYLSSLSLRKEEEEDDEEEDEEKVGKKGIREERERASIAEHMRARWREYKVLFSEFMIVNKF